MKLKLLKKNWYGYLVSCYQFLIDNQFSSLTVCLRSLLVLLETDNFAQTSSLQHSVTA